MGIHSLFKALYSNKMKLSLLLVICFLGFVSSAWININDELSSPSLEREDSAEVLIQMNPRNPIVKKTVMRIVRKIAMKIVRKIMKKILRQIVMMKILSAMKMPHHVKHKQNKRT